MDLRRDQSSTSPQLRKRTKSLRFSNAGDSGNVSPSGVLARSPSFAVPTGGTASPRPILTRRNSLVALVRLSRVKHTVRRKRVSLRCVSLAVLMLVRLSRAIEAMRVAKLTEQATAQSKRRRLAKSKRKSSSAVLEEEELEQGERYYPTLDDLEGLPLITRDAVVEAARATLAHFVGRLRLRQRVATNHWGRRLALDKPLNYKPATMASVVSAVAASVVFRAWPHDVLHSFIAARGVVHYYDAGEYLVYQGERNTSVYLLLSGQVVEATRMFRSVKRLSMDGNNCVFGQRFHAPCPVRDTAVLVEEEHMDGALFAATGCTVVCIPARYVTEAFDHLDDKVKQTVTALVTARRVQLMREHSSLATAAIANSPLFRQLPAECLETVSRLATPMAFLEGSVVVDRDERDRGKHELLLFVVRGTLLGATTYSVDGAPQDLVFAYWQPGESVGGKNMYFREKFIFSIRAQSNVDVWAVRRRDLVHRTATDRALRHFVAEGAFTIRCRDSAVRMSMVTVRAIPWIRAALEEKLITEFHVKKIFELFRFSIFPANDLVTSKSGGAVAQMIVVMTGTAIADYNGGQPFILQPATVYGQHSLLPMRWVLSTIAVTPCEGWVLSVEALRAYLAGELDAAGMERLEQLAQVSFDRQLELHRKEVLDTRSVTAVAITETLMQRAARQKKAWAVMEQPCPLHPRTAAQSTSSQQRVALRKYPAWRKATPMIPPRYDVKERPADVAWGAKELRRYADGEEGKYLAARVGHRSILQTPPVAPLGGLATALLREKLAEASRLGEAGPRSSQRRRIKDDVLPTRASSAASLRPPSILPRPATANNPASRPGSGPNSRRGSVWETTRPSSAVSHSLRRASDIPMLFRGGIDAPQKVLGKQ
jgi:CRP-like cAMP-binding protein